MAHQWALLAISTIAFPGISVTENDWASLLKATDKPAVYKLLLSASRAIRFNVFRTKSEGPSNDSKAMGMNGTPMLALCWKVCSNFLSSARFRTIPDFLAEFKTILGCSAEVMVTSRAAGCPADQQGKYTFPGRDFVSGIKFFCSQTDDKLAALQADIYIFWCVCFLTCVNEIVFELILVFILIFGETVYYNSYIQF